MRWVGFAAGNAKRSREITTEDESASTVAGSVIAFPASYVAKTRPLVERPSRPIVFGNFKKNGVHSEAGKPAQMQIEESPTHSFPRLMAATATDKISASPAAVRERIKPATLRPMRAR